MTFYKREPGLQRHYRCYSFPPGTRCCANKPKVASLKTSNHLERDLIGIREAAHTIWSRDDPCGFKGSLEILWYFSHIMVEVNCLPPQKWVGLSDSFIMNITQSKWPCDFWDWVRKTKTMPMRLSFFRHTPWVRWTNIWDVWLPWSHHSESRHISRAGCPWSPAVLSLLGLNQQAWVNKGTFRGCALQMHSQLWDALCWCPVKQR